jgi:hypothetical protein
MSGAPSRDGAAPDPRITILACRTWPHASRIAVERAPSCERLQEQRRDQDFEQVAERLSKRRAERQGAVVVDKEIADDDPRPELDPGQVEKRDPDPRRKPHDRRDRPCKGKRETELGGAVVERG